MFKKIMGILITILIATILLTSCKPSESTSGVSPTDLMVLLNKKATGISQKPGWLHMTEVITYDVDSQNLGILPNDTVIPLEYKMETWYHIGPDGKVYEYVQIQSTMDDDIIQTSIFKDGVIINFITNYSLEMPPYSLGTLDYRFSNEMADFMNRTSKSANVKVTTVNGRNSAIFTLNETLSEPAVAENYKEPVYSTRTVAYYDTDNGLLFRLERIRIFKNGSERTFYKTDITVEQNAIPTSEILNFLQGVN